MTSQPLRALRALSLAALLALALVRPAAAVHYTDIWWNPAEGGWGVNFIQSDNFIFATFFIYGTDNQPTWVTAQLTQGTGNVWSGPVYLTSGPYYGTTWDPSLVTTTAVGSATFIPSDSANGTLAYNIGLVNVSKLITRQTLKLIPAGGWYSGAYTSIYSGCSNPNNNGPLSFFVNLQVLQVAQDTNDSMQFNWEAFDANGSSFSFVMGGPFVQQGLLYQMPGAAYVIGSNNFSANVSEIKVTAQGIEGTWAANLSSAFAGCQETAFFSLLFITP